MTEAIDTPTLERLVALAEKQRDTEALLADLAERTKEANKALEQVAGGYRAEGELPALMQELGLDELKLADGTKIQVKEELKPPSVAANSKHRDAVIRWLDESGKGDVIKDTVTVPLTKGDQRVTELLQAIAALGLDAERFRTVAPQTLASLLRELLESGEDVPLDDLGVLIFRRSKVS